MNPVRVISSLVKYLLGQSQWGHCWNFTECSLSRRINRRERAENTLGNKSDGKVSTLPDIKSMLEIYDTVLMREREQMAEQEAWYVGVSYLMGASEIGE